MTNHPNIEHLAKLASPRLLKCLIYKDGNDYVLFNEYLIRKHENGATLYRYRDDRKFEFNHIRNATVWAILEKHNKMFEANRVLELDLKIESMNVNKSIHNRLKKIGDFENKTINTIKYQDDNIKQNNFQRELDKYIIMANNCQQRGFENELKRNARA